MKKIFAAFALTAALAVGMVGGAQAQTLTSNTGGVYSIGVMASEAAGTGTYAGDYVYTYVATLNTAGPTLVGVTGMQFGSISGYVPLSAAAMGSGFDAFVPTESTTAGLTTLSFTGSPGLVKVGDSATFSYVSTLPPTGLVNLTPSGNTNPTGQGAGNGTSVLGPGAPAIPEAGSFALFGLGLLPLALIARRRLARNA